MTTSGVSSFSFNRDQIIKSSLRKLGAIEAGEKQTEGSQSHCEKVPEVGADVDALESLRHI